MSTEPPAPGPGREARPSFARPAIVRRRPAEAPATAADAATPDTPPDDLVCVGRIAGAWGVRGGIKVTPFNAAPESVLLATSHWWLAGRESLPVTGARAQGDSVVAMPRVPMTREAVLALKGTEIHVRRSDFPPSAPGEYYWVDLIGCEVTNPAGYRFGKVVAVDDHGAHPLLDVGSDTPPAPGVPGGAGGARAAPDAERRLIPFVEHYLVEVDLPQRRIVVDWEPDY